MKVKILLSIVFLLINSVLTSCFFYCPPVPAFFEINGINSMNLKFTNSGSDPWEVVDARDTLNWDVFYLVFSFQTNYISQSEYQPNGSLMALTCDQPGNAGDKIGVDTLIVKTVYDYNRQYLAGDVINSIIRMNDGWPTRDIESFNNFFPIEEYIIKNAKGVRDGSFEVKLTEAPTSETQFAVKLTYRLNNGEEFEHVTETVILQ